MSNVTVSYSPPSSVRVVQTLPASVTVAGEEDRVVVVAVPGPQGPQGPIGGSGIQYTQAEPAATWTIPHTLARRPNVEVYTQANERVVADVVSSDTTVTVTFAAAVSGFAVLT